MRRKTGFAVAFAHIAAAAIACGGSTSTEGASSSSGGSSSGGTTACGEAKILDGLSAASPFDYLALVHEELTQGYAPADAGVDSADGGPVRDLVVQSHNVIKSEEFGTLCKTATSAACAKAAQELRVVPVPAPGSANDCVPNRSTAPSCRARYVMTTHRDDVKALKTPAELSAFLGPIDTPDEAWLMARLTHSAPVCSARYSDKVPTATKTSDGYELTYLEQGECSPLFEIKLRVYADGRVEELSRTQLENAPCAIGRRPDGLCDDGDAPGAGRDETAGQLFARAARLEDASVRAFVVLARELGENGAPASLGRRARRSARDEVRHARATARLAKKLGGRPVRARVEPARRRGLFGIALENAVEGCVRETYGALLAAYQARASTHADVRRELARIAADEARHAELSWDVHRWIMTRLDERERAEIGRAMRAAIADLRRELHVEPSDDVVAIAGFPRAETALGLFDALEEHTWGRADARPHAAA